MTGAHHDAAARDERCRREAALVGAEQRCHDDVPAGLELPVGLHPDARAEIVADEGLLRLGEPDLPRDAGEEDGRERRRARAAVVPGDEHVVGVRLGDAGRDRPDPHLRHELHGDARLRIGAAKVVDELLQVLDRVDVVVRRRRDEADAGRRQAHARDVAVDLVPRQLAALAGLRALRHLDLQLVRVREVVDRDPEAAGGDLLDGRATEVAVRVRLEPDRVLAALAGVGTPADAVHRDRERLVRLPRDRAEGHRARREALHDLARRLDLVERDATVRRLPEAEQPTQRVAADGVLVDEPRVLLEGLVPPVPNGVLQQRDRLRVPLVVLAVTAPGVEADHGQERLAVAGIGAPVPGEHVARERLGADAADARRGAREMALDELR